MLAEIDAKSISELFDEIPPELTTADIPELQLGLSELAMMQHMADRARQDDGVVCFAGGGGPSPYTQDRATSVIYGMPRAAVKSGCVDKVLPLDEIPEEIVRILAGRDHD